MGLVAERGSTWPDHKHKSHGPKGNADANDANRTIDGAPALTQWGAVWAIAVGNLARIECTPRKDLAGARPITVLRHLVAGKGHTIGSLLYPRAIEIVGNDIGLRLL
jgi:hypothetical protein